MSLRQKAEKEVIKKKPQHVPKVVRLARAHPDRAKEIADVVEDSSLPATVVARVLTDEFDAEISGQTVRQFRKSGKDVLKEMETTNE